MIPHQLATIKVPRWLYACLCAALLCSFFGVVSDTRAQAFQNFVCGVLDLSSGDCAFINSVSTSPTSQPWLSSGVSVRGGLGGSALRSASIGHNEQSCLVMNVSLPMNTRIRFFLSINAEPGDHVEFRIDDQVLISNFSAASGSEFRDYENFQFFPSGNSNTLSWCYIKNASGSGGVSYGRGGDSARLDALAFDDYSDRFCELLDMGSEDCDLIRSVSADPPELPWFPSSLSTQGDGSLRSSSEIDHNETSCLAVTVSLPVDTRISFSLRTLSEPVNDYLYFEADGNILIDRFTAQTGSERDWEQMDAALSSDTSSLKWCYTKNATISVSDEGGWIDALSFTEPPLTRQLICQALDMSAEDCTVIDGFSTMPPSGLVLPTRNGTPVGTDVPWFAASVANRGNSSLRSGNIDDDQASCLVLEITLSADTLIQFSLRTSSQGFFDRLTFFADNQLLIDNYSAAEGETFRNWEQSERFLLSSVSRLTWCFLKDRADSAAADSGWLDALSFRAFEDDALLTAPLICQALDMSAEDCSLIVLHGTALSGEDIILGTNEQWQITADASAAGGLSLRSRDADDDQLRCLVLNTPKLNLQQLDGFAVTVSIRTSSEGQAHSFEFRNLIIDPNFLLPPRIRYYDFISADAGSTERDWAFETYYLPPGLGGSIAFCYRKDSTDSEGEDAAWLDRLSFSTSNLSYKNRICETLDLTDQSCAMIESIDTNRDYLWAVATDASVQGGSSLRSRGEFNDFSAASASDLTDNCFILLLEQPLPGPTRIHYSRRINAEINRTRLLLTTNDSLTRIDSFSAENDALRDWEQGQFVVSGDVSSLTWCYVKDNTDAVGSDTVWIDALSFVTADLLPLCDTLDLTQTQCAMIRSATYEPPQNLWLTTTTAFIGGDSALVSPPLETGQSACLTLDIDSTLPSGSYLAFSWRNTSPSDLDVLEFQAGGQQSQLRNMPQWQTEVGDLNGSESTLRWCYRLNSTADSQTARAWLDNLFTVVPDDRYVVQIAVTGTPTTLAMTPPPPRQPPVSGDRHRTVTAAVHTHRLGAGRQWHQQYLRS